MDENEFRRLLAACHQIATQYPHDVVFIDDIAVYLHAVNCTAAAIYAESTHHADFYISFAAMSDLRDVEELTPNRRLSKSQFIKSGFEFDVYTERLSSLIVPYAAIVAHANAFEEVRVACLEHLLALKLEAFRDRRGSVKGEKDADDILRIALVAASRAGSFDPQLCLPYLDDDHLALLREVERSPAPVSLAAGNAVIAKRLRGHLSALVKQVTKATHSSE